MKESVAMIQRTLLRDTDATELGISALIGGDGANSVQRSATRRMKMQEKNCGVGPMVREEEEGRKVVQGEVAKQPQRPRGT